MSAIFRPHAYAIVLDRKTGILLIERQRDARGGVAAKELRRDDRFVAQLLAGVCRVRNQLAEKDVLIGIDRVHHQVQQLRHIGFEDMVVHHHHGRRHRAAIEELHRNYSLGNGGLCLKHLLRAPWLLKHFGWTVRSAWGEAFGRSRFDPELQLSHWPIVSMNLLGALRFAWLAAANAEPRIERGRVEQPEPKLR